MSNLNFEELPLVAAVQNVFLETQNAGSDNWIATAKGRLYITKRVSAELIQHEDQAIINAWMRYRKQNKLADSDKRKLDIITELFVGGQTQCFYKGRVAGSCSDEVDLDRIKPGSRGGQYTMSNCVIACSFHNRSRGDKDFMEFLNQ